MQFFFLLLFSLTTTWCPTHSQMGFIPYSHGWGEDNAVVKTLKNIYSFIISFFFKKGKLFKFISE